METLLRDKPERRVQRESGHVVELGLEGDLGGRKENRLRSDRCSSPDDRCQEEGRAGEEEGTNGMDEWKLMWGEEKPSESGVFSRF